MPLREHVRELRHRLFLATLGVLIGAVGAWFAYPWLFDVLSEPLVALADERGSLIALNFAGVATPLDLQVTLALFGGVLVTSPWWIYQLWAFVTPGLTQRERRTTMAFAGASVPLFLAGAALAWWVLPKAVGLLVAFTPDEAVNVIDAQTYLGFVMRMVLAFGVAFLVPVLMVGLNAIGIASAHGMLAGWRWAVLLAFVFAAVATPTADVVSMFALGLPICGLYFGAIGVCAVADRRRAAREEP